MSTSDDSENCTFLKIRSSSFLSGGVDLLLHLLTSIKDLPVTKNLVKQSGMGKAIGSIEKDKICAGTANESAILDRVHQIKSAWNASVKARKDKVGTSQMGSFHTFYSLVRILRLIFFWRNV